jgi:uncharacterized phiE125 gp8 family phage protein
MFDTWHDWNDQRLRLTRTRVGSTRLYSTADTDDLLDYLRLPSTAGTTQIVETFAAAIAFVEQVTGSTLDTSTLELTVDLAGIHTDRNGDRWVDLPLGPVSGLTSIEDDEETYTTSLVLDDASVPMRVQLPSDVLAAEDCVITYTAGWDDWDDVPQLSRTAVLFAFAHHWQNREAVAATVLSEIPYTLQQALRNADYRLPI